MKYGTNSPTVYQQVGQADIPPSQTEGHRALLPCSRRLLHLYGRTAVRWSRADSLVTIAEMIRSGFSTESALHRFLQTVNRATDCLVHGRFMMGHSDGFTAIAARFDHAALVVVTGFVASRLAKVHIDSSDAAAEPVQRSLHDSFHLFRKLLAALNIAICSDLNQHRQLRHFTAPTPSDCLMGRPMLASPFGSPRSSLIIVSTADAGVINIAHLTRMADLRR